MKIFVLVILIFCFSSLSTFSQLIWSTYIGGRYDEWFNDSKIDTSGNSYITGLTFSSNFPVTAGCYDSIYRNTEMYVTKLNSKGSNLIFSTFISSHVAPLGLYDYVTSITFDQYGNSYITGWTTSGYFPITANALDTVQKIGIFFTKINQSGSALMYSSIIGGGESEGGGITIDTSGNIYITGSATVNFPVTIGAYQQIFGGGQTDIFVSKLNSSNYSFGYSTYIGGSYGEDFYNGNPIALDKYNNVYIAGWTSSNNFPITIGAFDTIFERKTDSILYWKNTNKFVAKLNQAGSSLIYSTYIGGDSTDQNLSLAIDYLGNSYITGMTTSMNYPTTTGSYNRSYSGNEIYGDGYVTKLNPAGTNLIYSTFIGGNNGDCPFGIVIDSNSDVYISGFTNSSNFPVTGDAFDTTFEYGFLTELNPSCSSLIFSTFLKVFDPFRIALNNFNQIYLSGETNAGLVTTNGAYDETFNGGSTDCFVMKLQLCQQGGNADLQTINFIDFGKDVCTKQDTFYVKNTGECVLNITGCNITGTNASQFSLFSPNSFIASVLPGDSAQFIAQFASNNTQGTKTASMSLSYYQQTVPWVINLTGSNDVSKVQSDTIINFPVTFCSNNISTDTFFVKSTGICDLVIDSISLTGGSPSRFTIIKPDSLPIKIHSGDSIRFIVQYSTNSLSAQTTSLSLKNNSPISPWLITLSGLKIWKDLFINGSKSDTIDIDFGTICPGNTKDTSITIKNLIPTGYNINISNPAPSISS